MPTKTNKIGGIKRKTTLRNKADKLFSELIRSLGYCEKCGKTENLQCAHIISRSVLHLRFNLNNAFCLCSGCHMHFHMKPLEFTRFVIDKKGQQMHDELLWSSTHPEPLPKDYYENQIALLTSLLKNRTTIKIYQEI